MAPPTEVDDSNLKRRARRRLIGAIALALIAVIVLPMVFDAEKKPLDADISIQIPNKDALVTKGPGALNQSNARTDGKGEPGADAKAAPAAGAKTEFQGEEKSVKPGDAKGADKSEPKSDAKAEPKSAGKDSDAKATAAAKPGDSRSATALADEKRAAAILNAQADAAGPDKPANATKSAGVETGFAVQVGAFAAADKVKEARDKLSAAGIKTYTEKRDTKDGERTRVRAGPFAAREAADAAREQIRSLGFANANVVAR